MGAIRYSALAVALFGSAAMTQDVIAVRDLGVKQAGEQYDLILTAQNLNCEKPQDFEFQLDNMPFLTADGPLIVRGLGPGQSKSINATLDFQYTQPGIHYGRVTSRCITCGWYVFAGCNEQGQDVVLKITVQDPSVEGPQDFEDVNPYAGMVPRQPVTVRLVEPVSDENVRVLKSGDRKELDKARAGLRQAEARGEAAQERLANAQRAKSDCERKLARLKAEAAAAQSAADTAKQDARNAEGASKAADRSLKDFEKDNRRALKKIDDTGRAVQVAVRYRNAVEKEDGTGSGRYQRAQEQVDRFQQEHFDALREHTAISQSHEQRKAAAEKARNDAATAKAREKTAAAAAKTAHQKVKDQIKICGGQADAVEAAQEDLDKARSSAADAVRASNKAEMKAAKQALDRLKDRIKRQKQKCKREEESAKAELAKWAEAIEAGQKLKMLDDDGGRAASQLKAINDRIWAAAQDLAQDHTIATVDSQGNLGVANDETADLPSADTAEDVLDRVTTLMGWAVEGMSKMRGSKGVPDFGQAQVLGGMKALGMNMQGMVHAIRNPNTNLAQRNRLGAALQGKENYLEAEMREKGIGKNAKDRAEILKKIDKLFNDRDYEQELIARFAMHAARCTAETRALEQQRAELQRQLARK
ncbi:MAG: hypothetical protein QNJ15_09040 [Erythrobacter sp.]|nr:hypothetical protein [Erythrobacter sp.]